MARKVLKHKNFMVGSFIVIVVIFIAIFAPLMAPHNPLKPDVTSILKKPGEDGYLLGTDRQGRDLLSRILYGARIALYIGLVAPALSGTIGVLVGSVSGYLGGRIDEIVVNIINIFMSFPELLLAIVLMVILGPGLTNVIIALSITGWTWAARLVRSEVLRIKEGEFVISARAIGASAIRIMVRHILPNVISPILILETLEVASAIIIASELSFLGLGAQPPMPSWGLMLSTGRDYLYVNPWLCFFPGLAIFITTLGFNLMGDGLRDMLDPRLRGRW